MPSLILVPSVLLYCLVLLLSYYLYCINIVACRVKLWWIHYTNIFNKINFRRIAVYYKVLVEESFGEFPIRNFWRVKLANSCFLLSLFISWDIVKIWMVKFGEPPVICQIHQGFPPPKFHTSYTVFNFLYWIK